MFSLNLPPILDSAHVYDVIIVGGGSAGLAAGIYTARARLDCLLLEGYLPGGEAGRTDLIENYPGFDEPVHGQELMERFKRQAQRFGLPVAPGELAALANEGPHKVLTLDSGKQLRATAVIVATGTHHQKLGLPGEEEYAGRGVSYCATCDGAFFRDVPIAVVGGGDSALDEGLFLTRFASKVSIIHRRDQLRATKILQERVREHPKMELLLDTVVTGISGGQVVETLRLKNLKSGAERDFPVAGVFIFAGLKPNTGFLQGYLDLTPQGNVITGDLMRTSQQGVFAAGDCRTNSFRQIATAVGDGVTAAIAAEKYLEELPAAGGRQGVEEHGH